MGNLLEGLTDIQKLALKHKLSTDFKAFIKFAFKVRSGGKWISQPHHDIMIDTLQKVIDGDITRLIIVVPPRHSKSELVSIMLPAFAYCVNRYSNTIQTTFSDDLCREMSTGVKDVIFSEELSELFDFRVRRDKSAVNNWQIEKGGKFHAVATGGSVTGKGAGITDDGFGGLMVIDDPLKPNDAYSTAKRNDSNNRYTNTLLSRLAKQDETPVVIIQQRLHEDDMIGYLLNGGSGEKFHYLHLDAIMTSDCGTEEWYATQRFTHAIPVTYESWVPEGEEQALWPMRYPLDKLRQLEDGDVYTFNAQYRGRPTPAGGSIFKEEWWQFYETIPHEDLQYVRIYADTAHKTGEHNDYSVFEAWGYTKNGDIYLLDLVRQKWEAPDLERNFKLFYKKWKNKHGKYSYRLQCAKIEDKASGIGLIQSLKKEPGTIIVPIQREKDKVTRALGCAPVVQSGRVLLPSGAPWLQAFLLEASAFSPTMAHKHDDQMDPMFDAVEDMIIDGAMMWTEESLGDMDQLSGLMGQVFAPGHWN